MAPAAPRSAAASGQTAAGADVPRPATTSSTWHASGNKVDKTRAWFRFANESKPDALATLGKVITELMEATTSGFASDTDLDPKREKVNKV
jgi:hypothetical protein